MRIYKEIVEIKGYGKFDKICEFNKKSGIFSIAYPEHIVKDKITKLNKVRANTLKEAEDEWDKEVVQFESSFYDYKTVILYQLEENGSYQDGSGKGFVFNWGVFRSIKRGTDFYDEYLFERAYSAAKEISIHYHDLKEWKKLPWSKEWEDYFMQISKAMEDLYTKLDAFLKNPKTVDKQIKLLKENNNNSPQLL